MGHFELDFKLMNIKKGSHPECSYTALLWLGYAPKILFNCNCAGKGKCQMLLLEEGIQKEAQQKDYILSKQYISTFFLIKKQIIGQMEKYFKT